MMKKLLLTSKIMTFFFIFITSVGFSKPHFEKNWKNLNQKQKIRLSKIAKKSGFDLSTKNGRKLFAQKINKNREKFQKLSLSDREAVLKKRLVRVRKKLKEKGLSDEKIKKIMKRKRKRLAKKMKKLKKMK